MLVPGPPSFFADGMIALPPPTAARSGVRSSTKRPANGFSSTTTAAALRTGRLASRPPSLRISSTTVTILRIFTIAQSPRASPPERRAAEPCDAAPTLNTMKHEAIEQLGIEVRRFLRQHLAAAYDGLQFVARRRRDDERGLIASGARQAHRLGLLRRVVHVGLGVELRVRDVAE